MPLTHKPMPFIVGAARSGTTLLRLMLDAHPECTIPPETHFIPDLAKAGETGNGLLTSLYNIIVTSERWSDFHIPETLLRSSLEQLD